MIILHYSYRLVLDITHPSNRDTRRIVPITALRALAAWLLSFPVLVSRSQTTLSTQKSLATQEPYAPSFISFPALTVYTYSHIIHSSCTGTSEVAISTRSSAHLFKIALWIVEEGTTSLRSINISISFLSLFFFTSVTPFCSRRSSGRWNRCPHDLGR